MLVKRVSRRKHRLCVLKANDELHAEFCKLGVLCAVESDPNYPTDAA